MGEMEDKEKTAANGGTELVTVESPAEPVAKPRGQGLSVLALLVALGAAGAGYMVWQKLEQARSSALHERQQLAARLEQMEAVQQTALRRLDETSAQLESLSGREQQLAEMLDEMNARFGQDRRGWILAEAEYLLHIANRRLQLDRDVNGAIAALGAADQRLAAMADPLLTAVRQQISEELQAVRAVPVVDIDGISLELAALVKAVETLPITGEPRLPATAAEQKGPIALSDWRGLLAAVWGDIKGLVQIRRQEAGSVPLATPDQRLLLRQNLRLKLETARLAVLRGQAPAAYTAALGEASAWVGRYFDGSAPAVVAMGDALTRLAAVEIAPSLPAIDDSLRALRKASDRLAAKEATAAARTKPAQGARP